LEVKAYNLYSCDDIYNRSSATYGESCSFDEYETVPLAPSFDDNTDRALCFGTDAICTCPEV
jgi:hypothetical protein